MMFNNTWIQFSSASARTHSWSRKQGIPRMVNCLTFGMICAPCKHNYILKGITLIVAKFHIPMVKPVKKQNSFYFL